MTYEVVWMTTADQQLIQICVGTFEAELKAVSEAVDEIEFVLGRQPRDVGESRTGSVRQAFVRPLGFKFEIVEDDRRVYILAIWYVRRR